MMNAKPRQINTKTTTHQAWCGIPKNSSSQTAIQMDFISTQDLMFNAKRIVGLTRKDTCSRVPKHKI